MITKGETVRVLHVVDSLAGSGGAEHGLVREMTRFSSSVEHHVVRLFERDELQPVLEDAGIGVTALGFAAASASRTFPLAARRLASVIRGERPDVVHTSLFIGNLVGQIAARASGVPVLSTFVLSGDLTLLKATQPGAASVKAALMRRLSAASARASRARFRALSEHAKATNCALLGVPLDRVEVIPRGVPEPIRNLMPRRVLGLPESVPLIVNVGRVAAQKGQVHLLRSFAMLARVHGDAQLVIVGRPGDAGDAVASEIARLGLSNRVTMLGYTPHARHVIAHAAVFAFSSVMEGLGTAVVEALMAGVPVVAFDIPAVREATDGGRAAVLVPVGAEEVFAHELSRALDGAMAAEAAHGARFASSRGDLDAVAHRLEALLRRVADRSAPVSLGV
ncbi:MAG: glycosyltransferase [Acidimicrobiia bacterium]|nr:glycosyltransferase [Acidimicrobiia bacterium]